MVHDRRCGRGRGIDDNRGRLSPGRERGETPSVLSEEALIVLGAFGACGLLLLGVLELLWPARPRHPVRRPPPAPMLVHEPRPHRTSALVRHALAPGRSPYTRRAAVAPTPVVSGVPETEPPLPAPVLSGVPENEPPLLPGPARLAEAPAAPLPGVPAVEACFLLHQEGRFAEAIATATGALAVHPGPSETAALWGVVALARRALSEEHEAREALERAIEAAPVDERPAYQRQLGELVAGVARARLADAERARPDSEVRLSALREAATWLDRGLAATPAAPALTELAEGVQEAMWPAWERTVMALVQRQDFRAARRLLRDALADPRFPPALGETFRGLFSGTFSGEIGQLTARAIRSVQAAREADALAALQRAEGLLAALNDAALPPKRREEVDRRLWWGYRALGERRLASGAYEDALEPLLHALDYPVGPGPQAETRALLLRALDGVADARALDIREAADAGDREAAVVQCDKIWALLRSAGERGLSPTDLDAVHLKVQRLFESLGR
jgi:tetratricopeptide (TPR) repeat protein